MGEDKIYSDCQEQACRDEEPNHDPWRHRGAGMKCKTCMWFVPKTVIGRPAYDIGRCRRRAPTMNGYPVVFVNDFCGDHKIDETKI